MNIKYINTSALFNGLDGTTIKNSTRLCNKNGITYIEFTPFDKFDWVKLHFSTRLGGVSEGIYSSMNFSFDRGDSYDNVYKNDPQSVYQAQASMISPLVIKLLEQ